MINLYYLGQPYASDDDEVKTARFQTACRVTATILKTGRTIFSPVVHNHWLSTFYNLPKTWDFWRRVDLTILSKCTGIYILPLQGWPDSVGLRDEVEFAIEQDIPVWFIDEMGNTGKRLQSFEEYIKLAEDTKDAEESLRRRS